MVTFIKRLLVVTFVLLLVTGCTNITGAGETPKPVTPVETVIEVIRERFPDSVYLTDTDLYGLIVDTCQGLEDGIPVRELQRLSENEKQGLTKEEIEMFETVFVLSIATVCTSSLI
jgi:hypothetical protein